MLHVRLVSPAALTGRLAGQLTATPGVQNLVVQPGAATRPDGDSVQFDLRDEAANPVFRGLRGLGLDKSGVICVERVDATLADHALTAGHGAIVRERAPVWEMVEATIRAGAAYSPSFYILLVAAGLIGAVGILTNSQILIVGAMVVGPEYSAIIAVALGISKGARGPVRDGLLALLWGFLAGLVGVVSLTEARANALIGVFISVTTIPAAADVGVSLAFSSWHEARGSAFQLLLNIAVLVAVGAAGLSTQWMIWRRQTARSPGRVPS